ncbi:hypothetical protein CLOM_g5553 [Closterium sp. NIES-68]|nr:hypothetical protein CLOM_g5553 [Closterium sp. NIES-68]
MCEFLKFELEFLGQIVGVDDIKINPKKITTIVDWKSPTNLQEMKSFLGFVNHVRRFISNMTGTTGPLTDLLWKGTPFEWGERQQAAFDKLRNFLLSPPFLRIADPFRPDGHNVVSKPKNPTYCQTSGRFFPSVYVSACPICQRIKSSRQRPNGQLQPLEPPQKPWQHVAMDFVRGHPAGASGNDTVLFVVDRLTKMVHFALCHTIITVEETTNLFISTVVRLHGLPSTMISDHDPKFTSKLWQQIWEQYVSRLQFTSAYHPQSDGQTERTYQTMEQLIRTNCYDPARWEEFLPMLEFSYNNAPSATTNHSPFFLNYWMDPTA